MEIFSIIPIILLLFSFFEESKNQEIKEVYFQKADEHYIYSRSCDFFAQDLTYYYYIWSPEHCIEKCKEYGITCTHFAYHYNTHTCFLKTGRVTLDHAFFRPNVACGVDCHLIQSGECSKILTDYFWKPKFNDGPPLGFFRGKNCYFEKEMGFLSILNTTLKDCVLECRIRSICSHFNYMAGFCELFKHEFDVKQIKKCNNPFCHCGYDCSALATQEICKNPANLKIEIIPEFDSTLDPIFFGDMSYVIPLNESQSRRNRGRAIKENIKTIKNKEISSFLHMGRNKITIPNL